jgi:tRNA (guanine37-N1)-methyltransferase
MQVDIVTIFPDLFSSPFQEGIIRRALVAEKIHVNLHNIRDYAVDKHHMTDDRPFGGGEGMVMKPEPIAACLRSIQRNSTSARVILLSPRGVTYNQSTAERLADYKHLILICGRYEGVDDRIRQKFVDEEISIGDYILTGGELGAMVIVDSVIRLIPGVLGCQDSAKNDTFSRSLLKYPVYTRPQIFEDMEIPEILLSGNHAKIRTYRFLESVRETLEHRPELLASAEFSKTEKKMLVKSGLDKQVAEMIRKHG